MSESPPVVYLFHGEDEIGIAQSIAEVEAKQGDAPTASLNTVRLDGRAAGIEELRLAANAMPFLTARRIVVLTHPLARLGTPAAKDKFIALLDGLPPTTALVLAEYHTLYEERRDGSRKEHWLYSWAKAAGPRAYIREFSLRGSGAMTRWIQDQARANGGKFTPQAAQQLAELAGEDTRLAQQEIHKLLAYTNRARPVDDDDVRHLTAAEARLEDFALPNALRELDGRKALSVLHRLLEDGEPIMILGSIIKQVRMLLLAREVLDQGGSVKDVEAVLPGYKELKISAYPARLAAVQAQKMSMAELEAIYRRLVEIDEAIKSSQLDGDLALELFVTAFTTQQA